MYDINVDHIVYKKRKNDDGCIASGVGGDGVRYHDYRNAETTRNNNKRTVIRDRPKTPKTAEIYCTFIVLPRFFIDTE